jgi:HSP20 family protein
MTTQNAQNTEMATTRDSGEGAKQRESRGLARWSPFTLLDDIQDEFARLWGRPLGFQRPSQLLGQLPVGGPRLDVYEDNGNLVVMAEFPGVKKEDLQVELDRGDLVIRGETRAEDEINEDQYYRMERRHGSFYRRVPLGFDVDPEKVEADLREGVLELRIPKPAETKSTAKRVPVR